MYRVRRDKFGHHDPLRSVLDSGVGALDERLTQLLGEVGHGPDGNPGSDPLFTNSYSE
jgi:hypothetical protein